MHHEAYEGFARMLAASGWTKGTSAIGLDVGGADVNGSVRDQLPDVTWIGLDIEPAPGVEIVADAATWRLGTDGIPGGLLPTAECFWGFDIVIATELFEHAQRWPEIIQTMALALRKGGPEILIATCASTGRPPHGARGEWGVPEGQYYGNVAPDDLRAELEKYFTTVHVEYQANPGDAYMYARGLRDSCICGSGDADEDLQGRNPRCQAGGIPL